MRTLLPTLLLSLLPCAPPAAAQEPGEERFRLDPQHSFARFEYDHWGLSRQQGRFDATRGHIILAPDTPAGGLVDVEIETQSISTGSRVLDDLLRSEDFFDAATHPRIHFRAHRLIFEGERLRSLVGELAIKGVTRPVTLDVTHIHCRFVPIYLRRACGAHAQATILRSSFGMGRYSSFVSDEIQLSIVVEALQEASAEPPP